MKFATISSFLVIAAASVVSAAPSVGFKRADADVVVNYNGLGDYVYAFGECIPFEIDGAAANSAQVNKIAKCYAFTDNNCQNQANQFPVIVPPGVNFLNAGNFVNVVGESGMCWELE